MIHCIQDLDIHVINHCDHDSLINLSHTNKYYNKVLNICFLFNNMDEKIKLLYSICNVTCIDTSYIEKVYNLFTYNILYQPLTCDDYFYLALYYTNVNKNNHLMIHYHTIAAKMNEGYSVASMMNLGRFYKHSQNYHFMVHFLKMAAERYHGDAMYELGVYYYTIKNYNRSLRYYIMAFNQGIDKALINIPICYKRLDNYDLMVLYLKMGSKCDYVESIHELATYYHFTAKNYARALRYYFMAIDKGHVKALDNVGYCYHEMKEYTLMEKYYLMAIEQECINAMVNLGNYYKEIKNYELMVYYYKMTAKENNDYVMNELGVYYHFTVKNYARALRYYFMAIDKGNVKAMDNVGYYYHYYPTEIIKYKLAKQYYTMSIENGYTRIKNLGTLYESNKKYVKLLQLYLKHGYNREKIINTFNIAASKMLNEKNEKKLFDMITSFDFESTDKLRGCLRLLINSHNTKVDLLKLHFKYTVHGKGYNEAKDDFDKCVLKI